MDYEYIRGTSPCGHWDIGYSLPYELEPSDHPEEFLVNSIYDSIEKKPILRCEGSVAKLIFDGELTTEEKTTIDTLVSAHKAAADHT